MTTSVAETAAKIDEVHCTTLYDVEHLATFSTGSSHETVKTKQTTQNSKQGAASQVLAEIVAKNGISDIGFQEPRVALQKLFQLEKLSGIWTQRMQIELQEELMLIVDCETNATVERFCKQQVTKPEAFNQYNDIYNNIVVFVIEQQQQQRKQPSDNESEQKGDSGELHIFQCVSHQAQQLVEHILAWKQSGAAGGGQKSANSANEKEPDKSRSSMANQEREEEEEARGNSAPRRLASEQVGATSEQDSKSRQDEQIIASGEQQKQKQTDKSPMKQATSANKSQTSVGSKPPVVVTAAAEAAISNGHSAPIVNVNVKETVQVFNQIAALREQSVPITPPTNHTRPHSDSSLSSVSQTGQQQQPAKAEINGSGLGQGAQLYKQRSIRAILAPPASATAAAATTASNARTDNKLEPASKPIKSSLGASQQPKQQQVHLVASTNERVVASHQQRQSDALPARSRAEIDLTRDQQTVSGCDAAVESERSRAKQHQQLNSRRQQLAPNASSNGNNKSTSNGGNSRKSRSAPLAPPSPPAQQQQQQLADQVATNESYVSVLNHCFDDIEKFIIRLQQSFSAARELQHSQKQLSRRQPNSVSSSHSKRTSPLVVVATNENSASFSSASSASSSSLLANGGALCLPPGQQQHPLPPIPASQLELASLAKRARGPTGDDYFEILSKFKLAFNLLAKLKGCIHEPNAPELVHFLFTPLAIIIESARNVSPAVDPTLVGIPYLNRDALELLSNCCTSKESDLWLSLGANWTQTIDASLLKASRLPSSFQPIFSDGWAPVINELELIGLPSALTLGVQSGERRSRSPPLEEHIRNNGRRAYQENLPPSSLAQVNNSRHHYREPGEASRGGAPLASKRRVSPPMDLTSESFEEQLARAQRQQQQHCGAPRSRRSHSSSLYNYHSQLALASQAAGSVMHNGELVFASNSNSSDDYTELQDHLSQSQAAASRHELARRHYRSSEQVSSGGGVYAAQRAGYMAPPAHGKRLQQAGAEPLHRSRHRRELAPETQLRNHLMLPYEPAQEAYNYQVGNKEVDYERHAAAIVGAYNGSALLNEREAMLADLGPAQTEWFYELQARAALIVRVLFTREANNDKELCVRRGELLEVLDDSRKWWKARNIDMQVAHVPHTIVAIMDHYQTLDELLTNTSATDTLGPTTHGDNSAASFGHHQNHQHQFAHNGRSVASRRSELVASGGLGPMIMQPKAPADERGGSKAAGAFRYF